MASDKPCFHKGKRRTLLYNNCRIKVVIANAKPCKPILVFKITSSISPTINAQNKPTLSGIYKTQKLNTNITQDGRHICHESGIGNKVKTMATIKDSNINQVPLLLPLIGCLQLLSCCFPK